MPVEVGVWKVGAKPERLLETTLESENQLEDMIVADTSLISDQWMLIGRQVATSFGSFIDLLAIDMNGSLIIIELKKHKTPREVVAQTIDYASWVKNLQPEQIADVYSNFSNGKSLNDAFEEKFGTSLDEDQLNETHQMVIVAAMLDRSTERIVNYLNDMTIPLNVIFFRVFKDGENVYISRTWLIDPEETPIIAGGQGGRKAPWNGEYYVSFGHGPQRDWEDARKFGFISAGGGNWYTKTLFQLKKGDRVWTNIPKTGYVGVGEVQGVAVRANEFEIETTEGKRLLVDASNSATYHREFLDDEVKSEYFVPVKWTVNVSIEKAVSEVGFFGNQNSVCRPTTTKWSHTVERLKKRFEI